MFIYEVSVSRDCWYCATIESDVELSDEELQEKLSNAIEDGDADCRDYNDRDFSVDSVENTEDEEEFDDEY